MYQARKPSIRATCRHVIISQQAVFVWLVYSKNAITYAMTFRQQLQSIIPFCKMQSSMDNCLMEMCRSCIFQIVDEIPDWCYGVNINTKCKATEINLSMQSQWSPHGPGIHRPKLNEYPGPSTSSNSAGYWRREHNRSITAYRILMAQSQPQWQTGYCSDWLALASREATIRLSCSGLQCCTAALHTPLCITTLLPAHSFSMLVTHTANHICSLALH